MRPEKVQRRLRFFAIGVAAFFGALAVATWWSGRENLREGSRVIGAGDPAWNVTRVPVTYRAVYRVENRAGSQPVTTTERVWVHRPFQSRTETYTGPPPGTDRLTVRQSAFGILASSSRGSEPLNIAAPPSIASGDVRVDAVLRAALEEGLIFRRERREVYGRQCQVYRAGGPVFAGDIKRLVPGSADFADFCVDRNGLVVEEAWTLKDRLVQRRVAVEIQTGGSMPPGTFEIDVPPSAANFRGSVEPIDPSVPSESRTKLWTLDRAPEGFEHRGRYAVGFPPGAVPRLSSEEVVAAPNSTTDVFVRGPDLVVIDQDPSLASAIQAESRPEQGVKVEGLNDAKLIVDARMSEIRGETDDGSIVRIFGTLPPSELIDLARRLRPLDAP